MHHSPDRKGGALTGEELAAAIRLRIASVRREVDAITDEERETFSSDDIEDEWHSLGMLAAYDEVLDLIERGEHPAFKA